MKDGDVFAQEEQVDRRDFPDSLVELIDDERGHDAALEGVELDDVVEPGVLGGGGGEARAKAPGLFEGGGVDVALGAGALQDLLEERLEETLGVLGAAHGQGLVGDAPEELEGVGLLGGVVLNGDGGVGGRGDRGQGRGLAVDEGDARGGQRGHGGRAIVEALDQDHVLAADGDLGAIEDAATPLDLDPIDEDAVAAPHVFHEDPFVADGQERMLARDQGIIKRELALGAASDEELARVELQVVVQVPESVSHDDLPRGVGRAGRGETGG